MKYGSLILLVLLLPKTVRSDDIDPKTFDDEDTVEFGTVVEGERPVSPSVPPERAVSRVDRETLDRRPPRSAPDALRYEPGVFVQQTAHSQGSAYIRGMTGQQTLLLFDGIRLNNSVYRQGPNQYFFTLDSHTIHAIEVMRGGGSTMWGSDALGGVILSTPIEQLPSENEDSRFTWYPNLILKGATADNERGGRLQVRSTAGARVGFVGGVGGRRIDELRSGGVVTSPETGIPPRVPRFADDGKTQRGTGFDEFTADGRLVLFVSPKHTLKAAGYTYRQFDAPRTDQCPAAYAPYNHCLLYDEQWRDLVYVAYEGVQDTPLLSSSRLTVSWQRQHERRTLSRPTAHVRNEGRDQVDSLGLTAMAISQKKRFSDDGTLRLQYGGDTYFDMVRSLGWITFTDVDYTRQRSRGQYLDHSTYLYGGAFLNGTAHLHRWVSLRAGGRIGWIDAHAPEDRESGSHAVDATWIPLVWNGGIDLFSRYPVGITFNVDRSFRAPNLDDLTSRQQTGPGFQFENAALEPETAVSYEAGIRINGPITAQLWGFITHIEHAIVRSPRSADACPANTPMCAASWTRFQLENAPGRSIIRGLEAIANAPLPGGLQLGATVAWTFGEGQIVDPHAAVRSLRTVPLSRIPPLNGTVELLWKGKTGFSAASTLRWATTQDRLALSDISDERIPQGGTPGFAVVDVRISYRTPGLLASLTFENLSNEAYRYHGSAINGPGRGVMFLVDLGPVWRHAPRVF